MKQMRTSKTRRYRMGRRAEQVDQTRHRIVEAAVRLHTSAGPANTSIAGIAEAAGVTRVTVYRHFPDVEVLFEACQVHWEQQNPGPDPVEWRGLEPLEHRALVALRALYPWYREHADELYPIHRDLEAMPAAARERTSADTRALAEALVEGHGRRGRAGRGLLATAGHVASFWTWRSLALEQGLDDEEAAELGARFLAAATAATA